MSLKQLIKCMARVLNDLFRQLFAYLAVYLFVYFVYKYLLYLFSEKESSLISDDES